MSLGIPPEILRFTTYPFPPRLDAPMGSAEKRSPICGSRVIVDLGLTAEHRVQDLGMRVNACAFGQAAAAILAKSVFGRSADEIIAVRDLLARWIAEEGDAPNWPDIVHIRPDRLNSVRKASVQLAFQAAAEAADLARASPDA